MSVEVCRANPSHGSCSACAHPADFRVALSVSGYQSLIIRFCENCLYKLNVAAAKAPKHCPTCGKS